MGFQKRNAGPPKKESSSPLPDETPSARVLSLRLPPPLREVAERYADATGLSLNGLLCVALTDYLASRGHKIRS